MLAFVGFAAIDHLPDIEAVLEHMGERSDHETRGGDLSRWRASGPWLYAFPFERRRQFADRTEPQIVPEDFSDEPRLVRNDFELLADASIAERDRSPDPNPLALRGRDLVAHALADHLALELRE